MILDLIILSNNKSIGIKSKTNYSDLNVDVNTKSNSNPLHVIDSELVDDDSLNSRAILISNRLITNYQDNNNNHNSIVDKT